MSSPALERKVRQLDNDVQSIYEMLSAISGTQLRHGNRLDEIDQRLEVVDSKLDGLETRFDGLETRFDGLVTRFDGLVTMMESVEGKLDSVLALLRGRES